MPQASDELREKWKHPADALAQLNTNFTDTKGLLKCKVGYKPTEEDYSAIDYLCYEWDFAYAGDNEPQ